MSAVAVYGAGGMGREAAAWLADCDPTAEFVGFLDDDPASHGRPVAGASVLGGDGWLDEHPGVEVVLALGAPRARATVLGRLDRRGTSLRTLVHPTAVVGPRTRVGRGSIVCPGAVLTCDVTLEEAVIVNFGALVGHDVTIGSCAFIAPGASIAGTVRIGARADVGIGAAVIQGVRIGDDAVIGAGAAVIRDVPDAVTAVGVPARIVESGS